MGLPPGLITGVKAKLSDGADKCIAVSRHRGGRAQRDHSKMNKWEAAYAWDLEIKMRAGMVRDYTFKPFKVRLGKNTHYWIDFLVVRKVGDEIVTELIDVKGHLEDDAAAKFKVAREQYPFFRWRMLRRQGGAFVEILK